MSFLDHYNDELRQLREAGARFSKEHPQVASELGLHPEAITDPFVERLLEGVAYLSARVQTRLDRECAEFAQQALGRICPLFMAATPVISTFAFHPDLDPRCVPALYAASRYAGVGPHAGPKASGHLCHGPRRDDAAFAHCEG